MPAHYRFVRIWSPEVSDNSKNNFISGNFARRCHRDGHGGGCISLIENRKLATMPRIKTLKEDNVRKGFFEMKQF